MTFALASDFLSLSQTFKQLSSREKIKIEIDEKMSDQQVTAMLENLNNNFLSIMSMCFGLNCRLNAQETLIREIHEKLCGNEAADRESSQEEFKDEQEDENQDDEEKIQADLNLMAQFVSTMVTSDDPKIKLPKEEHSEVNDKGKKKSRLRS